MKQITFTVDGGDSFNCNKCDEVVVGDGICFTIIVTDEDSTTEAVEANLWFCSPCVMMALAERYTKVTQLVDKFFV